MVRGEGGGLYIDQCEKKGGTLDGPNVIVGPPNGQKYIYFVTLRFIYKNWLLIIVPL